MLPGKIFYFRIFVALLLTGSIFAVVLQNSARAAPDKTLFKQDALTDTNTDTPSPTVTFTLTPSPTPTLTPTLTPTYTSSPMVTLALTETLMNTLTPSQTQTNTLTPTITNTINVTPPTPTPIAPQHIVISEFRTTGPLGADDEFVELYNPTGVLVNIGNWYISRSSSCGSSLTTLVYIYYGTILQAGQHYLVASYASYSSISNADQRFSPGIADTGGIALVSSDGTIIDQVGMCSGTYYHRGTPLAPLPVSPLAGTPTPEPGTSDQSYERKPGGNTSCYDTGDNSTDFRLISPANPQSQTNPSVLCAGVVLTSPTPSPIVRRASVLM